MDDRTRILASTPPKVSSPPGTVVMIDNFLPEHQRKVVQSYLRNSGWRFGWKSSSKKDVYSFWHRHFAGYRNGRGQKQYDCSEELKRHSPLMFAFWQLMERDVFPGHTLVRCYANAQSYGTDGTLHRDSKHVNSFTSVYYPHEHWEPNWAGETAIFNDAGDEIVGSIYPRPNRLVVFRGNAPHVARGVSRTCPELRVTLMFKTVTGPLTEETEDD